MLDVSLILLGMHRFGERGSLSGPSSNSARNLASVNRVSETRTSRRAPTTTTL